ncbi:MAG: hypothetical protein IJK49_06935, partial [Prevotella sp.]|nr:hypothetical protein [Prevotella sp.]
FFEKLSYNTATDGGTLTTPCYNGNISAKSWKVGTGTTHRYEFAYDNHARLATASYGSAGRYNESYTYDSMGNVTSLQRYGKQTRSGYGLLDNLQFTYDGNQIKKITNDMLQAFLYSGYRYVDAADTDTEFEYDANGNMTRYADRRITSISYNLLNLPEEISMLNDNHESYQYDTEGNKLHVRYKTSEYQLAYPGFPSALDVGSDTGIPQEVLPDNPMVNPHDSLIVGPIGGDVVPLETSYLTDDYCVNVVYEDSVLKMILLPEGYISKSGDTYTYHYYLKDHLGSNHVVLNGSGTLKQQIHYYTSGLPISDLSGMSYQRYMFQGKLFDTMHGLRWHDHGARFADNTILRWTTMDPLCEKYYDTSPYVFCANNTIRNIDPDGKAPARLIVSAAKFINKAYHIYKKTGRLSPSHLKSAGISELIDVTGDLMTIFDSGSSTFDKIKAGIDLIVGTDINNNGKATYEVTKRIKANKGFAKPHGGAEHNKRIDDLIDKLRKDHNVSNIRKNQKQVDVNGNVVGNNRPDVQFDKNGVHTNVEYDRKSSSLEKHKKEVTGNDPNARNKFYKIN